MSQYRRLYVPGASVFFTLVTHQRRRFLTEKQARYCLREALTVVRGKRPFEIVASVLLPDHLHLIWNLPVADVNYSVRWRRIKEEFTQRYLAADGQEGTVSVSRRKRSERGIWQRRFWEHTIRDEDDFADHFHYIHYNPVKHGLVRVPFEWPYSSFDRWVRKGIYPADWGSGPMSFDSLDELSME